MPVSFPALFDAILQTMFVDPAKCLQRFGLEPGLRVADLGCGAGFYTLAVAREVGDKGRVYAVDIRTDMLEQIRTHAEREHLDNVEVVQGELEDTNGTHLADDSVHASIIANTLFQLESPKQCIAEAARITEDNGRVLIVEWSESFGGLGPPEDRIVSEEKARTWCTEAGLTIEESLNAAHYHYGFICRIGGTRADTQNETSAHEEAAVGV